MSIYMDEEDAMARLGNNKKLYAILLKKFDGAAMFDDLKNKLASGDAAASQAQAHTIKGLAANLSLKDLSEKASAMELAFKNGASTDALDAAEIAQSVAATEEAVKSWISGNS